MLKLQYACWRRPSWMEVRVTGHNFENWPLKDHPCHVCFKLAYWFQRRRFLNIFPIGSYVKTMSADGGHLGWWFGSLDIILKVDHLRTIHAMFALNWLTGFRGNFFLNIFPIGSYVKTMSADGGHLWMEVGVTGHNFESLPPKDHSWWPSWISDKQTILKFSTGPPNDHSCKVTIQLA
jgi:hypothetical protein